MRLRQPRMRGTICLGHSGGPNGEGGNRLGPRSGLATAASSDPEFNAKAIYNLAIQGDEEARKIFGRVGRALGICLANLVNAFNLPCTSSVEECPARGRHFPHSFLKNCGSVLWFTPPPLPPSQSRMDRALPGQVDSEGPTRTIITRALLGSDAGLYGAAELPMARSCSSHPKVCHPDRRERSERSGGTCFLPPALKAVQAPTQATTNSSLSSARANARDSARVFRS